MPAATIRRIAKEFVDYARIGETIDIDGFTFPFRPVSLNTERNVTNHRGGTYADLTGKIINMLVGNIEVPGGCLVNGPRGPFLAPEDGFYLGNEYRLDIDKRHTLEEIYDRQIRSWKHNKKGWGLKELKQAGFLEHRVSRKEFYNYYWMPGNQTRHPFYFEHLKAVGDGLRRNLEKHGISMPGVEDADHVFDLYKPIPHRVENSEFKVPEEYDLWAFNWRTLFFSNDQSHLTANPWLAEFFEKDRTDGTIGMNEKTAMKKGFEDGDLVIVASRYGKVGGRVHLSELFHEDSVGISGCYGLGTIQTNPQGRKGPHYNTLLPMDDKTLDGVSAGIEIAPRVKVYKKAMP